MKKNKHQEQADEAERIAREQTAIDNLTEPELAEQLAEGMPKDMADGLSAVEDMAAQLVRCESEFKELSDRYLRLMAEYDNFRRRSQKEREALYADSVVAVVKEWLPVVDNLNRAEQAALAAEGESARRIADGVLMILKQAGETLSRLNVKEIDCLGQSFDPNLADAVMHVEDESVGPATVVEVMQKGYARDERVIRHSIVKVAN